MARSNVWTYLPLDRFTRIISYSPLLFSQVYVPGDDPFGEERQPAVACSDPVLQYSWQPKGGGRPGRDEIAQAIAQAEEMIVRELGFPPVPTWIADDRVVPPRSMPGGYGRAIQPWMFSVRTNNKYVIQGGQEAWAAVQLAAAITYSDVDGDGYFEKATVTVATTVTDVNEIAVYYPGESHDPGWEIRPIKVTIAGGNATITFDRQQAVLPDLLESLGAVAVDGTDDDKFLTTVDVYRHYNDPSQMAILEWTPSICDLSGCQIEADTGCLTAIDERNGIVTVHAGTWDSATSTWTHDCCSWWQRPMRTRLWYRAGYRAPQGTRGVARPMHDMAPELERAISLLALSLMDRMWCTCEQLRNMQAHWRADLSMRSSNQSQSVSYQVSRRVLDNPFGPTRAASFAWDVVQKLRVGEAVIA